MDYQTVMKELEKLGTAQNRKVYKKHGAGEKLFGVSFAHLYKIQKKIEKEKGKNLELAKKLWGSENTDARTLALLIADPEKVDKKTIETWLKETKYYMLVFYIGAILVKTRFFLELVKKWVISKKEVVKSAGYSAIATRLRDGLELDEGFCEDLLKSIEKEIHKSPNRARHNMNGALIAIGGYKKNLRKKAIEVAKRIGKVEVDHGDTSCKTPDAVGYIKKIEAREKKKGAKKVVKKKVVKKKK